MTQREWFAVEVKVSPDAADTTQEALAIVADLGTSCDSLKKAPREPVCVTGFFSEPPEIEDIRHGLEALFAVHGLPTDACHDISTHIVKDADWLVEWKRHWQPHEVGRFVVTPPWLDPGPTDKLVIRIEPNMAFGTGTHETTQLCLEAISELFTADQSMLDVGTGTGILAIAAAKIGGTEILACDTDADSVKIARENAALNEVDDRVDFFSGSIGESTPSADLVVANLTIDVILPLLSLLLKKVRRHLVLSGILAEQEPLIADALSKISDIRFEIRRKGEWIAVIVSSQAS